MKYTPLLLFIVAWITLALFACDLDAPDPRPDAHEGPLGEDPQFDTDPRPVDYDAGVGEDAAP